MRKVDPRTGLRSAQMRPECCNTMVRQMASPRPVPPFCRESEASTCWKRPKIVSSLSAGIPRPWSITERITPVTPGRSMTLTGELGGENLTAFESRLVTTWSRRSGSAEISTLVASWISCTPAASAIGCMSSMACFTMSANCTLAEGKRLAPALDPLEIENVVDQANQPVGVGEGDAQQVGGFFVGFAENAGGEQPQSPADGSERRAQLVADGGDEFVLQPVEGVALADVAEAEHRAGKTALTANGRQHIFGREGGAVGAKDVVFAGPGARSSCCAAQRAILVASACRRRAASAAARAPACR